MTEMQAWTWIINSWHTPEWMPVNADVRTILHLPKSLGMCGGQLITQQGAKGMMLFIQRFNSTRSSNGH